MVETLPAAIEMEEMLYELKDYACGMNAGRWDYIFSAIKRLQSKPDAVFPDRKQVNQLKVVSQRLNSASLCLTSYFHTVEAKQCFFCLKIILKKVKSVLKNMLLVEVLGLF